MSNAGRFDSSPPHFWLKPQLVRHELVEWTVDNTCGIWENHRHDGDYANPTALF